METSSENLKKQNQLEKKSRSNHDLSEYPTHILMHTLKNRINLVINREVTKCDQFIRGANNNQMIGLMIPIFSACIAIMGNSETARKLYFRAQIGASKSKNIKKYTEQQIQETQQQIDQQFLDSLNEIKEQKNEKNQQDPSLYENLSISSNSTCQQSICQLMNKLSYTIAEFEGALLQQKKLLQQRKNCHSSLVDSIIETGQMFSSEEFDVIKQKINNDTQKKIKENSEGLLKVYEARQYLDGSKFNLQKRLNKMIHQFSQLNSDKKLPIQASQDEEESKLENQQLSFNEINQQNLSKYIHQEIVYPQTSQDDQEESNTCSQFIQIDATTPQPQDQFQEETKQ